jgi:hypothetical protein
MVYVREGAFYAGDNATSSAALKQGSSDTDPWRIGAEDALSVTNSAGNASGSGSTYEHVAMNYLSWADVATYLDNHDSNGNADYNPNQDTDHNTNGAPNYHPDRDAHNNTNDYTDTHSDGYSNGDTNRHSNSYRDCDLDGDTDSDRYFNAY